MRRTRVGAADRPHRPGRRARLPRRRPRLPPRAAGRAHLPAALGFLREVAGQLGLGPPDVAGLARAVEEVCLNVIEHGFEPGQPASFDVVILRRPGQLVVAVEDRGLPFDWSRLEAGTGSALAAPSLTAGTDDV